MRRAVLLVLTSAFLFLSSKFPSAQQRLSHNIANVEAWLQALEQHRPGESDPAAQEIGALPEIELDALFVDAHALVQLVLKPGNIVLPAGAPRFSSKDVERLMTLARDAQAGGINRLLKRSALLHTDIALLVPQGKQPSRPAVPAAQLLIPHATTIMTSDGQNEGTRDVSIHLAFASLLLDRVKPTPSGDEDVRLWYQALALLLVRHHYYSDADPHLEHARRIFPDDAELLVDSGSLYEALGAPAIQSFVQDPVMSSGVTIRVGSARANWQRAERFFRRAVELDERSLDARLRLGRVMGHLGRHEEAATQLEAALALADESRMQYFANLFLGAEQQALGRFDKARDSFERATALYPQAQSPHLALSQLARRQGDRAAALLAIQPLLAQGPGAYGRDDPWWSYHDGPAGDPDALLARVRAVLYMAERR